ncbi:MAG: protein kinase [Gemmatimonadaceae bacterium]
MQITAGTRIGVYEVIEKIGAGGMGNVYRAHDPRLGRDVAIKALPEHMSQDSGALARFEREARFVAALNQPNIAAIYGIEEHAGERVLVLELVRGETLDTLLRDGPLSLERTLRITEEVASALEAAHGAGIIHRDLKPSNVKVTTDGHVKLLDFGIAKHRVEGAPEEADAHALDLTRAGAVVGTPQYMSPEQINGETIDRRTDIWAFGCLLFEMLSGQPAFMGATYAHLADAVLHREPQWSALPGNTPVPIRRLVARCLKKDRNERLHDIADARVELHDAAMERSGVRARSPHMALLAGAGIGVAVLIALLVWRMAPAAGDAALLVPKLTQLTAAEGIEEFPAWSPDGQSVVYSADVGGVRKLFVRPLGGGPERQVTRGNFDDMHATWAPAGTRILFVRGREPNRKVEVGETFSMYEGSAGDVWAVDVETGHESRLIGNAFYPSLSPDGKRIAVDASWAGPRRIWITDERGFNPQPLTSEESEAVYHIHPRWSPDGRRLVYQRIERTKFDLSIMDVTSRVAAAVTNDNYREMNPAWGADGKSIYFSSDRGGGINVWRIGVGEDGRPTGPPQQLTNGAGQDVQIAVAPDGSRLAYATLHQNADLWRLPLTADGKPAGPPVSVIASSREDSRGSWSPDGRELVFFSSHAGSADIWKVDVATGQLAQLTSGASLDINPFFSPDGREVVYQSDSSGRLELWIVRADGSARRQLTTVGSSGHFQLWRPDGWIYFRNPGAGALMRVRPDGGEPDLLSKSGGAHISFTSDASRVIDVMGHNVLYVWTLSDGKQERLFAFDDADVRIDYPSLSPDGRWLLFDRFRPDGGDIWLAEGLTRRR